MNNEVLSVLEYMEKEKGICRQDMISAIISAIHKGASRCMDSGGLRIDIDSRTGVIKAWRLLKVVDVINSKNEIHIENAREKFPMVLIGQIIEKETDRDFLIKLGRIAAQTTRQAISQTVRQFEKEKIFDEFKQRVGDIVSGVVRYRDNGNFIVDLGKTDAVLPLQESIPCEEYAPGDKIRCLLSRITATNRGPELILSRSNINFVKRLLELEVTEIFDGTVVLKNIVREPGYRTKISVNSYDPKVDPVGACVGTRGVRIKSIIRELGNEKIDIIRFSNDVKNMLIESVKPTIPKNIKIDKSSRTIYFEVPPHELSLTIGRKGQNAKLTSRLIGWHLDINKNKHVDGFDQRLTKAISILSVIPGIDIEIAHNLVSIGINTIDVIEGVTSNDLIGAGFKTHEAKFIISRFNIFNGIKFCNTN